MSMTKETQPIQRAALALTKALTRVSDRPDPVSDEVWRAAARNYGRSRP
jgi:hypothetical protein